MSNFNTIAKLLISELYNMSGVTYCGPDHKYWQYHPEVKYASPRTSGILKNLPYIIPSKCFHPKIAVVFDFTHKFTADFTSVTGFSTERPVSEATLFRVGTELTRFFDYYFEYVLSYGSRADKSKVNWQFGTGERSAIRSLVDWSSSPPEDEINLFVNEILNFFLMAVSVDKTINEIGTCTINFTNNYNFKNNQKRRLLFDQTFGILNQLFAPMVPVMVWASGRLYPDWMFPIFDGYVTSPESSVTGGFSELQVHCKDALELARISTEMVNPSIIQNSELVHQNNINIFSQPLYGQDHLEIVKTIFLGGDLVYDPSKQRLVTSSDTAKKSALNFAALGEFDLYEDGDRATKGTPAAALSQGAIQKKDWNLKIALAKCSHKRKRNLITWGESITPYRILSTSSSSTYTGEFSSRFDILQNIAQIVYYNFYVDGYGDINYHPMRLTNDFLLYEVISAPYGTMVKNFYTFPGAQVIGDTETTNASSRVNVDELMTFLRIVGHNPFDTPNVDDAALVGSAVDQNYMARFGYRRKSIKNDLFNYNPVLSDKDGKKFTLMDLCAKALLQYSNGELYTTSRTLIFRPELKLAAPVLFPEDNEVFYCQSISHSIRINGEATTTINANLGRKDEEMPSDMMSFILLNEVIYKTNKQPPAIPANATPEEIQKYYESYYGINELPFARWLNELDKQAQNYNSLEDKRSLDSANNEKENF